MLGATLFNGIESPRNENDSNGFFLDRSHCSFSSAAAQKCVENWKAPHAQIDSRDSRDSSNGCWALGTLKDQLNGRAGLASASLFMDAGWSKG